MEYNVIGLGALIIFLMAGYYYNLHGPQSLETYLREPPYNLNSQSYQMMYISTFFFPLIIMIPLGFVIDKVPLKYSLLTAMFLLIVSQYMMAIIFDDRMEGYLIISYITRGIFGLSGELTGVLQALFLTSYAPEHYQQLIGIVYIVPAMFIGVNSIVTTQLYSETHSVPFCFFIGFFFAVFSFIIGILMVALYIHPIDKERQLLAIDQGNQLQLNDQKQQPLQRTWTQKFIGLGTKFWVIYACNGLCFLTFISYYENLNDLFVKCYGIPYETAGAILSGCYVCVMILSVFNSYFSKRFPTIRRKYLLLINLFFAFNFICLYSLPDTTEPTFLHYFVIAIFLISFSLMYTSGIFVDTFISYVVEPDSYGIAWSIVATGIGLSQFIGTAASMLILQQKSPEELPFYYHRLTCFFMILSFIPIGLNIYLNTDEFEILDSSLEKIQQDRDQEKQLEIAHRREQLQLVKAL